MTEQRQAVGRGSRVGAYFLRLGLLLAVWWILSGSNSDWWFGLPLAIVAAAVSVWLSPPARSLLRPQHIPRFAAFFLWHSLLAGWDVAKRTLSPGLPLHPEILRIPMALPAGAPTWWLMLTISLLPGTLSVRLDADRVLEVHCLDAQQDVAGSIRETEAHLARLFGAPIPPPGSGPTS